MVRECLINSLNLINALRLSQRQQPSMIQMNKNDPKIDTEDTKMGNYDKKRQRFEKSFYRFQLNQLALKNGLATFIE